MRFRAPRSTSPSPVRRQPRRSSTFGLNSDSDSEDYLSEIESSFNSDSDSEVDVASIASSSASAGEETIELVSDINKLSIRPSRIARTPREQREIAETISAIRLRSRYHDPYEAWEHQIRTDSFYAARKEFTEQQSKFATEQEQQQRKVREQRAAATLTQATQVKDRLEHMRLQRQETEMKMKQLWKQREKELWDRIEVAIKQEEEKLAKRLEEERRVREEEERKVREEEERKRLVEEKRLKEEAERKRVQEEKEQAEREAVEKKRRYEEEKKREMEAVLDLRMKLSLSSADDDWRVARTNLCNLKNGSLQIVKGHKELKSEWLRLRRLIVVRIGQLTNDDQAIARITADLIEIVRPSLSPPHPEPIYVSLCSSLAKAILLQAETEVSAESHTAEPLARVAFSLIDTLENFAPIFFCKLVQRCGGWPVPFVVPPNDVDETPWASKEQYAKVSGWRKSELEEGLETMKDRVMRISALMRVYFNVVKIRPERGPLDGMFQLQRVWIWFARVMSDAELLRDPVAPWLIYTGLDVLGLEACSVWGKQWAKMLNMVHEGVTMGTGDGEGKLIGGDSLEAGLGRARILFVLGNIVNGVKS